MIAFVLSGAGNRGPLEVGALQALHDRGIKPDLIVGTSAGAINGLYVATHGLRSTTAEEMGNFWAQATSAIIYPGTLLTVAWRFVTGANSLYPSDGVRTMLERSLPADVRTFGDCKIPFLVTSSDLLSSRLFLFGEDKRVALVDAVLASASVPVIHPPVTYGDGLQLVDGGAVANVAASVAMDKGATEVYVINASWGGYKMAPAKGVLSVLTMTLNTMIAQSFLRDMDQARKNPNVTLHHLYVGAFHDIGFRDFSKTHEMIGVGKDKANRYLDNPQPESFAPAATPHALPEGRHGTTAVVGPRDITPEYLR